MIKITNNIVPFKGYAVMTIWPLQFIRKGERISASTERHELTHAYQQREMFPFGVLMTFILFLFGCGWWSLLGLPFFYWWYLVEWIVKWAIYKNRRTAYKNLAFEREARENAGKKTYNQDRCSFAWVKYLKE